MNLVSPAIPKLVILVISLNKLYIKVTEIPSKLFLKLNLPEC